jgi:hypothetical protein
MNGSVENAVEKALNEMGMSAMCLGRTILLHDGQFVGIKFLFDGGYAVQLAGTNSVDVYDDAGTLLRTVSLEEMKKNSAA